MDTTSQVYISLEVVIGVASVFGNALVLAAIHQNMSLQTVTNCFIASLALADLLVGIIVAPLAALSFLGQPTSFTGCVFTNSVVVIFTQISIFSLVAVGVERFIAINKPFFYQRNLTIKVSLIIITVTWVAAIIIGLVPVFGWNLGDDNWKNVCNFVIVIDMKYMVYFNFFGFVLTPLLITFALYSYIFYIVKGQLAKIAALEIVQEMDSVRQRRQFKRDVNAAKSLAIVVGMFALCWLPIHILNSITLLCGCPFSPYLLLAAILLSHLNSAINPFLYAIGNSKYQTAFKRMFCKKFMPNIMNSDEERTFTNANRFQGKSSRSSNNSSQTNKPDNDKGTIPSISENHEYSYRSNKIWTVSGNTENNKELTNQNGINSPDSTSQINANPVIII